MTEIISLVSFRGGTGKTTLAVNLATIIASQGYRVALVDLDFPSPGVHYFFFGEDADFKYSLFDFVIGRVEIDKVALEVKIDDFSLYVLPGTTRAGELARLLREGYDVGMLNDGLWRLIEILNLDYVICDTHPGIYDENLLVMAISNSSFILLRPDSQDFQGTAVMCDIARKLENPAKLIINMALSQIYDLAKLQSEIETIYSKNVAGTFAFNEEIAFKGTKEIFALENFTHPFTLDINNVAYHIIWEDLANYYLGQTYFDQKEYTISRKYFSKFLVLDLSENLYLAIDTYHKLINIEVFDTYGIDYNDPRNYPSYKNHLNNARSHLRKMLSIQDNNDEHIFAFQIIYSGVIIWQNSAYIQKVAEWLGFIIHQPMFELEDYDSIQNLQLKLQNKLGVKHFQTALDIGKQLTLINIFHQIERMIIESEEIAIWLQEHS